MKKITVIIISIVIMSFKSSTLPKNIHVPEFLIIPSDWVLPVHSTVECETYSNNICVDTVTDYLNGIDSVAVKYVDHKSKSKSKTTYTNFYCRQGKTQSWKKYNKDKVLVQFVSENRSDTVVNDTYYNRVYYRVK